MYSQKYSYYACDTVDPHIKKDLQMKLADAQTNMRAVQQEEQELSAEDKAIQAAGREYKAKHVSDSYPCAVAPTSYKLLTCSPG